MNENTIRSFKDLRVWQEGHRFVLAVYECTKKFPPSEQFGLINQLRRAVVSITSNIAEGFNRQTKTDKAHFYFMALGSCSEVQNQLTIAYDLKWIDDDTFATLYEQTVTVHKLLTGLIKSTKARI